MKMSQETFKVLKNEVTKILSMDCIPQLIDDIKSNPRIKIPYVAFIWKIYHIASKDNTLYELIRKEDLFDAHIETAMKQIIKSV